MSKTMIIAHAVKELVKDGKTNGFVTQEEILSIFPKPEDHIFELDDMYAQLIKAGVDVFETLSDDEEREAQKTVTELEKELESLAAIHEGGISDPVRMYLKEIGRTPLLKLFPRCSPVHASLYSNAWVYPSSPKL